MARLDTMVTVVDTAHLLKDYSSHDFLKDRGEVAGDADERPLVQLLVDQIEFADVIILNKTDIATPAEREAARAIVRSLNAGARIIETSHAKVDPRSILDTGLFDFDTAHRHPTWYKELNGFKDHQPETAEYGISSFVYRARGPFEPAKLHAFFSKSWPGVIRAKGFFWLATRPQWVGELAQAGALVRHEAIATGGPPCRSRTGRQMRASSKESTRRGTSSGATGGRRSSSLAHATWMRLRSRPNSTRVCCRCQRAARWTRRRGRTCPIRSGVAARSGVMRLEANENGGCRQDLCELKHDGQSVHHSERTFVSSIRRSIDGRHQCLPGNKCGHRDG